MMSAIKKYYSWLHGQWPDRSVEKQPLVQSDGRTNIRGVFIVGDLTGVPLLKFSADSGAKAVATILAETEFVQRKPQGDVADIVIIGGGVSGYAAAIAGRNAQLDTVLLEANQSFSTIDNFPNKKPIYTYPTTMTPAGDIQFSAQIGDKEGLLRELKQQVAAHDIPVELKTASHIRKHGRHLHVELENGETLKAHRVIVAIGRSGNFRKLNIPGENLDKVSNRLIDARQYQDKELLIVGGGDSALEAAIATQQNGAKVTLSYRQAEFRRAKQVNVDQVTELAEDDRIQLKMASELAEVRPGQVVLRNGRGHLETVANDNVLLATGREAPLDFFRRSKVSISGEGSWLGSLLFVMFLVALTALYDWKGNGFLNEFWSSFSYPENMPNLIASFGDWWQEQVDDRSTLVGTLAVSLKSRSFYYTFFYTLFIAVFGWQRIQRRRTPYVTVQTTVLFFIQLFPLFLLPEIILPLLGYNGVFEIGMGKTFADALFPSYISAQDLAAQNWPEWGHPRAYWQAYSFILAWPLSVYAVFSDTPQYAWLGIAAVQTFVLIPLMVKKWGKGAYCSWICSCGAMAETMGDQQRHKMPHGPGWNKLNMLGQLILLIAVGLLLIRVLGWVYPETWMNQMFALLLKGEDQSYQLVNGFSYKWVVDIGLAGILGFGLYFKYSGRTWCRFACPLAALMHIYARFSRFAIASEKSKCISCNQCTSNCHQGIDVMAFASQGKPMTDPQCVRCSACVQVCPTGTLSFVEIDPKTEQVLRSDALAASPVQIQERMDCSNLIEVKNV